MIKKISLSKVKFKSNKAGNVLAETAKFKLRNIELKAGQMIPACEMKNWVLFYVRAGQGSIRIDAQNRLIVKDELIFTSPALVSLAAATQMKILGIIIK